MSSTTVGRLLHRLGYRLQSVRKRQEGTVHPDRNEQFEHINATADRFLTTGQPVISVDTKKKELVGNFANAGREWQPKATPPAVRVHDFPSDAEGKAIPYGVFDMARNEAWVSVGWDHDTPTFAVASIRHWWQRMGRSAYLDATTLYITADAGGSNGYRSRSWKHELQKLADETRLTIHVSHFPPGTSKWNKVEHRLFCHITANWRGTPLTTYETIVDRIGNTRTEAGLQVQAELDTGEYPTGVMVTKSEMDALALVPEEFTATGTTSSSLDEVGNSIVESTTGAVAVGGGGSCSRRLSPSAGASLLAVTPFPVAAHRTGRAGFPHPALGRDHAFYMDAPSVARNRLGAFGETGCSSISGLFVQD